jgi:DNA-directed RNA polymerase I and III subunit RPAC1
MYVPKCIILSVVFGRLTKFFLVCVESEGPYAPERILPEAIKVMREKLAFITEAAVALRKKYAVDNDVTMHDA